MTNEELLTLRAEITKVNNALRSAEGVLKKYPTHASALTIQRRRKDIEVLEAKLPKPKLVVNNAPSV